MPHVQREGILPAYAPRAQEGVERALHTFAMPQGAVSGFFPLLTHLCALVRVTDGTQLVG